MNAPMVTITARISPKTHNAMERARPISKAKSEWLDELIRAGLEHLRPRKAVKAEESRDDG